MATNLNIPTQQVKLRAQVLSASPSGRARLSYLWRAVLLYLAFNAVISPFSLWLDIYRGWRFGHSDVLLLPFIQGSFFFYAVVLNSDSMFRAFHEGFVLKKPYVPPKIYGIMTANFILILLTFFDFFSREQEISARVLALGNTIHPCQPASLLPEVPDQLWLLAFTLFFGYLMNHFIAESDITHMAVYRQGGEA